MNERDIELAAKAGAHWEHGDWNMASSVHFSEEELKNFANLIRADEREACAKVLEGISNAPNMQSYAAAIRARGEK